MIAYEDSRLSNNTAKIPLGATTCNSTLRSLYSTFENFGLPRRRLPATLLYVREFLPAEATTSTTFYLYHHFCDGEDQPTIPHRREDLRGFVEK